MAFSASLPRPGIKMNSTGASFGGCSLCSQGLLLRHHSGSLQICEFTVLIAVEVVHGITVRISEVLLDVGLAVDLGHALDVGLLAAEHRAAPCGRARRPGARRPQGNPWSRKPQPRGGHPRWCSAWPRPATAAHLPQLSPLLLLSLAAPTPQDAATSSSNNSPRPEQSTTTTDFEGGRELLASGRADVNYAGVVWLKARRVAEAALRDGAPTELRAAHEEIRADVSPLFLTAGNGDAALVRALLVMNKLGPTLRKRSSIAGSNVTGRAGNPENSSQERGETSLP
ncbi:hypothetical protein OsI_22525 [Oryza sativa Indica Group]|uniref:Uncharacterized protein n=1 Tax=Oryza sativa subsp. indica TaxID=39946 RepID=B8B0K9_ORYSI|nr:hypothetical protein OsI_22525 [Oryza sativa Indica Group]